MIRPLKEFPLMKRYKAVFPDINQHAVFAYDGDIYCDDHLPDHLIVHENEHLIQQDEIGLEKWVDQYLTNPEFRLNMEVAAYQVQVRSIKDRNRQSHIRLKCAEILSSSLYGNLININDALKLLK